MLPVKSDSTFSKYILEKSVYSTCRIKQKSVVSSIILHIAPANSVLAHLFLYLSEVNYKKLKVFYDVTSNPTIMRNYFFFPSMVYIFL